MSRVSAFQVAGMARAKALWWTDAWHVLGTRRQAQVKEGVKVEMRPRR